jgi:hypothetical protein
MVGAVTKVSPIQYKINKSHGDFVQAQGCELRPQGMHLLQRRSQAGRKISTAPAT